MGSGQKAGRGCGVLGVGGGFVVGRRTEGRDENTAGKRCTRCINIYTNDKKSSNLTNSQHSLRNLAKFREMFIEICAKVDENCEKHQSFGRNFENCKNFSTKSCQIIEFRAVQRNDNLVDLEKCCKMSIWLQKSASIQPRSSPCKLAKICEICCKIGVRYGIESYT